jgi:hypothetical protein
MRNMNSRAHCEYSAARKHIKHAVVHLATNQHSQVTAFEPRVEFRRVLRWSSPHAPVRDHVKHRAKLAGLAQSPRRLAIHRVEQTADRVQHGAELWVDRHEEERDGGEDDTRVADQVGHEEEDVLVDSAKGQRQGP